LKKQSKEKYLKRSKTIHDRRTKGYRVEQGFESVGDARAGSDARKKRRRARRVLHRDQSSSRVRSMTQSAEWPKALWRLNERAR